MHKQHIGIWGFGAVGKSALQLFRAQGNPIEILELKAPEPEISLILSDQVIYTQQASDAEIINFLERNELIIVSPGIDTSGYTHAQHKFVTEVDLLASHTTTPLIGITGTVGKTTVTTLLSYYLQQADLAIGTGGNIGKPMLDFLTEDQQHDYLVLELSSFQLEFMRHCAPKLAIWTNLYPNHLDRHLTFEHYFLSKLTIMRHQRETDTALIPLSLAQLFKKHTHNFSEIRSQLCFFSSQAPTQAERDALPSSARYVHLADQTLVVAHGTTTTPLITLDAISLNTFTENIVILAGALFCLGQPLSLLKQHYEQTKSLEHRLEHVATYGGIMFYNDSKSTIMQATHAAVDALGQHAVILLLGGLSKGVDRTQDVYDLAGKVQAVICFGKEAGQLHALCQRAGINSSGVATLEDAVTRAGEQARRYDNACIVLSPGGSSFDLFANYIERGNRFKELVVQITSPKENIVVQQP